jgi:hypothetical protein
MEAPVRAVALRGHFFPDFLPNRVRAGSELGWLHDDADELSVSRGLYCDLTARERPDAFDSGRCGGRGDTDGQQEDGRGGRKQ